MLWYCFVGDAASFSNSFRLVSSDYGKPMWFVEVADLSPAYTTVSETKPPQAVLRDLNIGFQGWF